MVEAVEGEENTRKSFQPKAQEKWRLKIRPGEASRLSGPAMARCVACGDSLPPPLRKPGSPRHEWTPQTLVRYRRLMPGSPSVSGAAALLPRKRCETLLVDGLTAAVGCDCSRRAVANFASPQSRKPSTNWILQCLRCSLSREAPRNVIHTIALLKDCDRRERSETKNDKSTVSMLCKSREGCGRKCKIR